MPPYPHSTLSNESCPLSTPTDPPTPAPHPSLREDYEEIGIPWRPDPSVGRLFQFTDYPAQPSGVGETQRDAGEALHAGARSGAPPSVCNTRVENSEGVDYGAFTHRTDRTGRVFGHLFRILDEDWEELPHGGYLYRRCRKWGGVRVYYDGLEGMGSYCQVSGDGCRELCATGRIRDWQEFAIHCTEIFHVKCRRLDIFRDEQQGLLCMDEMERKMAGGECTTHAQEFERRSKQAKGKSGMRISDTLYIGSRHSESMLRIYNKTLELRPKGRKIEEWQAEHGHHVRVELELKGKRAVAAMKRLAQTGFGEGFIAGLIRGFIDFKASDAGGHNGRRVPTWGPWREFLGGEAKVKLDMGYVQPTLDKSLYHHKKQYGPTVAMLTMRFGGDVGALADYMVAVAIDGRARMRSKHYKLVEQAMGVAAA